MKPNENDGIVYYSVIVRAPQIVHLGSARYTSFGNILTPMASDLNLDLDVDYDDEDEHADPEFLHVRQGSLSIFGKFQEKEMGPEDYSHTLRSGKSRKFRERIATLLDTAPEPEPEPAPVVDADGDTALELAVNPGITIDLKNIEMEKDPLLSPTKSPPLVTATDLDSNLSDVYDYHDVETPRSPNKQTRLEVQFGAKLPKIRADIDQSSQELPASTNNHIQNILNNAELKESPPMRNIFLTVYQR